MLVGKRFEKKRKMKILKGVTGALQPVYTRICLEHMNLACPELRILAVINTTMHTVLRCCVCCASLSLRFAVLCACQNFACMHISSVMLGNQHHHMPVVLLTHPRALDPTGAHVPTVGAPRLWQIILAQNSCWKNQKQQVGSG